MRNREKEARKIRPAAGGSLFSDVVKRFVRNRAALLGLAESCRIRT